jgi:hypothetical protein
MAIWQYDFIVAPRDEITSSLGASATRLTKSTPRNFWREAQPKGDYALTFKAWRPEINSWSPDLRMWGTEESNRIDVHHNKGKVSRIEFRVELRSLNIQFVELLARFSRESNCVLISAHSLEIIEPLRETILNHIFRSPGSNRVWNWLNGSEAAGAKVPQQVFLSHSSLDKAFVRRLAVDVRAKGIPVWLDQWELKIGDSLSGKIAQGIGESGWLAVVLSKQSVKSSWVQRELNAALALELRNRNVFVLPLVIDDCDIPLFLLDKLYADFKDSYDHGLEALLKRILEGD